MSDTNPRPNLNFDKDYLSKVSDLIVNDREKQHIHFEYLSELVNLYHPGTDIYRLFESGEAKEKVDNIVQSIFTIINDKELSVKEFDSLHRLWDYLSESDTLEKSDLIYVFGGISKLAVQESIGLKKENYAPYILFSGKHASYTDGIELSEAEQYRNLAIENGINAEDIIIEKESVNTPENIVKSKVVLEQMNFLPKKLSQLVYRII